MYAFHKQISIGFAEKDVSQTSAKSLKPTYERVPFLLNLQAARLHLYQAGFSSHVFFEKSLLRF